MSSEYWYAVPPTGFGSGMYLASRSAEGVEKSWVGIMPVVPKSPTETGAGLPLEKTLPYCVPAAHCVPPLTGQVEFALPNRGTADVGMGQFAAVCPIVGSKVQSNAPAPKSPPR